MRKIIENVNEIKTIRCEVDEQETTYQFARSDSLVYMYTADNTVLTKMRKLIEKFPDVFTCEGEFTVENEPLGYFFTFPKKLLNVRRPGNSSKKNLSVEERKALGERLKSGRNKIEN